MPFSFGDRSSSPSPTSRHGRQQRPLTALFLFLTSAHFSFLNVFVTLPILGTHAAPLQFSVLQLSDSHLLLDAVLRNSCLLVPMMTSTSLYAGHFPGSQFAHSMPPGIGFLLRTSQIFQSLNYSPFLMPLHSTVPSIYQCFPSSVEYCALRRSPQTTNLFFCRIPIPSQLGNAPLFSSPLILSAS